MRSRMRKEWPDRAAGVSRAPWLMVGKQAVLWLSFLVTRERGHQKNTRAADGFIVWKIMANGTIITLENLCPITDSQYNLSLPSLQKHLSALTRPKRPVCKGTWQLLSRVLPWCLPLSADHTAFWSSARLYPLHGALALAEPSCQPQEIAFAIAFSLEDVQKMHITFVTGDFTLCPGLVWGSPDPGRRRSMFGTWKGLPCSHHGLSWLLSTLRITLLSKVLFKERCFCCCCFLCVILLLYFI